MLLSIIIATIAGVFTYFTYKLKIGQKARACCGITYSKDLPYISSVIIENQKDKDLVIHEVSPWEWEPWNDCCALPTRHRQQ